MYSYLELEKFLHALEMWNSAESREPQVDSDEVLEKQNNVINGGNSTLRLHSLIP